MNMVSVVTFLLVKLRAGIMHPSGMLSCLLQCTALANRLKG